MRHLDEAGAIGAATLGTGAAITAGIASACCIGPALAPIFLTVLGAGGLIAVASLRPFTPWMLLGSGLMLGFSFWQLYRRRECATTGLRVARVIVWIAAVGWVASTAYAIYGLIME